MNERVRIRRKQGGQSLVELALTLPLLALIVAGATHYGMLFRSQHVITNASRVGARRATQPEGDQARVQQVVLDYIVDAGLDLGSATVQMTQNGLEVTVTVTYQFTSPVEGLFSAMTGMVSGHTSTPLTQLQATTVMRL